MRNNQFPNKGAPPVLQAVNLNILSVDDDEVDRLRLNKLCRKAGMTAEFHEAANLDEMRQQLDTEQFDLVFLDHNLGMDTGLDALKQLVTHEDQVQAVPIMLTSATNYHIAVEAMRRGCADYIVKDELTTDSLMKSIASALERRALYGQLSSARASEKELKRIFQRFIVGCGPDLRLLLRRTLAGVRVIKSQARQDGGVPPAVLSDVSMLERSCKDLVVFMDDLDSVIEDTREFTAKASPNLLQ
ncbi:response regulator [Leisingera caerulea]|uniref:Response regulator n=1 Tax=Leisingera caerulea TaxID=506591 RepID=A0A9Q9LXH7_LEICA|nr:response regulator [Leisingera caerulea]UWQ49011.1 response regulator [Leisingera caerulea]UWQ53061.1 response regulator [Leisingera caerulea]